MALLGKKVADSIYSEKKKSKIDMYADAFEEFERGKLPPKKKCLALNEWY